MKSQLDCIPCFTRQALDAVSLVVEDPDQREILLRRLLQEISKATWQESPPAMGQRIHRIIRKELACPDPYAAIKTQMNEMAARLVPAMRERIEHHANPREAAVRVAIGGNLLDTGSQSQISADELPAHLETIWHEPLHGSLDGFFSAVEEARSILYLADNAGEIVFDRLLLEHLPTDKVTLVVRGAPVLNDVTRADADTAGIPELVPVIDNGSDAPGTILEDCSAEFRKRFDEADLIIAKGQGNFETLSDIDKPIFFLFTVKCPLVAEHVQEPVGGLVVKAGRGRTQKVK
jgi:damage-control phosphatase, subfamily I